MTIEPREHFWNIDLVWLFYACSALFVLLFAIGAARAVRRWARGWSLARPVRRDSWVPDVVAGSAIFRGDRPGGWAHLLTLWGFVVLFIGTVLLTIDHYLIHFLVGHVWLVYSLLLDLFGAAFVLALIWLLLRRHLLRRRSLHHREPEDSSLLLLLLVIGVTGFLVEGLRIAETRPVAGDWSPVGSWFASFLPAGSLVTHRVIWWVHALSSLALVAWIPFGKLRHMFTSALHRRQAARTPLLRTAEERERAEVAFGAHELLAVDACTRCNRCEVACPSNGVDEALSPRSVVLDLARASLSGLSAGERAAASAEEVPWLCTSCGACRIACPVRIDAGDLIRETRGYLVEEGANVPDAVAGALENIAKQGNPWGGKRSKRAAWAEGLDVADLAKGASAPLLWLPGCELAYDTRCQEAARATAKLFAAAGTEVMIAGKREANSGDLARRCGEDGLFEMLVEENSALFDESGADSLVVSSPHDWHAYGFEYPRLLPLLAQGDGEQDEGTVPPARHVTQWLAERVRSGELRFAEAPSRRITYHDPCYLGRHHAEFDGSREILRALPGVTLVEMDENRDRSRCCGGGGGRMWFEPEQAGGQKMSERRVRQAAETGAEVLAVACPWCLIQFEDAVKTAGLEGRLRVADVTELAAEGLKT